MSIRKITSVLLLGFLSLAGCNRAYYRKQADQEVSYVIAGAASDPRWSLPGINIEMDRRSRYFEPYNQDAPPMPPDDPASAQFMRCVNGMNGWKHWWENGVRDDLENPGWRENLGEFTTVDEQGRIVLSLESALQLAYLNSPAYQSVLETLYLSALDVTTERFRLDTQFFGGNDTNFAHLGKLRTNRRRIDDTGEFFSADGDSLRTATDIQMRRRFATAGELLVGFANSFLWEFSGPNTNSTLSILDFSLVQPLLRGAGRDIALEQLTIVERAMLANLRTFQRYRQGFYTDIAIGEGVAGPSRRGGFQGGTGLTGFSGQGAGGFGGVGAATGFGRGGFGGGGGGGGGGAAGLAGGGAGQVGGFIGLLQSLQNVRNQRASLNAQLRELGLLEANLDAGVIDLTQVDQFRQNIETEKATLLQAENGLKNGIESYVRSSLGLPPDIPVTLDDTLIQPFQLIDDVTNDLQDAIIALQDGVGDFAAEPDPQLVLEALQKAGQLESEFKSIFENVEQDLDLLAERAPQRRETMAEPERQQFDRDTQQLSISLDSVAQRFLAMIPRREEMLASLTPSATRKVTDDLVVWLRELLSLEQELSLVQARSRLESVVVEPIELDSRKAYEIALANRLDIMNNRAALVDSWRLLQFNADALQSNLDVFFEGDLQTTGNNAFKFRSPTGSLRAGVRFDAPFTRLLERNNYRQQLIEYQRDRRELIQFYDGINQTMRALLRNLNELRINLEIQRRAAVIAIRRVDVSRENLNQPQPPPEPGQPASQLGPTVAQTLLSALSDLRNTQDNFMSIYLNYYAGRMRLERELGIMAVDEQGRWVERPLTELIPMGQDSMEEIPLVPPAVPQAWLRDALEAPPAASRAADETVWEASTRRGYPR